MTNFAKKKQLLNYLFVLWGQSKIISEESYASYEQKPFLDDFDYLMRNALNQLNDEQKMIIIKEFIEKKCPHWYLEFYSRSSFYRHKHQSMDIFIRCLHGRKMIK